MNVFDFSLCYLFFICRHYGMECMFHVSSTELSKKKQFSNIIGSIQSLPRARHPVEL